MQAGLESLQDVLFRGNSALYTEEALGGVDPRVKVLTKLPNVMKIDGKMVSPTERDEAAAIVAAA